MPQWFEVPLAGEPYDVINNVGSRLVDGGYGGDRGFLEADVGQYEHREEVFAWCGAATLLSRRLPGGRRDLRRPLLRVLRRHRPVVAGSARRVAVSVRTRVGRAPCPRGDQLGGLEALRGLRREKSPAHARAQCSGVAGRRGQRALVARHGGGRAAGRRTPTARPSAPQRVGQRRAHSRFGAFLKLLAPTLGSRRRQRISGAERRRLVARWAVPR